MESKEQVQKGDDWNNNLKMEAHWWFVKMDCKIHILLKAGWRRDHARRVPSTLLIDNQVVKWVSMAD